MPNAHFDRREFLKLSLWSGLTVTLGIYGSYFYGFNIEPDWLQISHLALRFPNLPPSFEGYKIVHITDIHADREWMTAERIANIVDQANQQAADLVVITGDFVIGNPDAVRASLLPNLNRLEAKDGIYAVLGNHDHWTNAKKGAGNITR